MSLSVSVIGMTTIWWRYKDPSAFKSGHAFHASSVRCHKARRYTKILSGVPANSDGPASTVSFKRFVQEPARPKPVHAIHRHRHRTALRGGSQLPAVCQLYQHFRTGSLAKLAGRPWKGCALVSWNGGKGFQD